MNHIPTKEIQQDISDTMFEIYQMKKEALAFNELGDRLSIMKRDYRINGIREREIFIEKLKKILTERESMNTRLDALTGDGGVE